MRKIPTMFVRDPSQPKYVTREVDPECQWVIDGEGIATRKWDGMACLFKNGRLYKRNEWGAQKGPAPASFLHWSYDPDQRSGHGWLPVGDDPNDWMHRKAFALGVDNLGAPLVEDATYELCGPKIQKNPEGLDEVCLIRHGRAILEAPRTFDELHDYLGTLPNMEGIVFWHPDGRMAKIKRRDFKY